MGPPSAPLLIPMIVTRRSGMLRFYSQIPDERPASAGWWTSYQPADAGRSPIATGPPRSTRCPVGRAHSPSRQLDPAVLNAGALVDAQAQGAGKVNVLRLAHVESLRVRLVDAHPPAAGHRGQPPPPPLGIDQLPADL